MKRNPRRSASATASQACCSPLAAAMTDDDAEGTARVFKALADRHRVRIVNLLASSAEPVCVCDITAATGLSQPTTSFHLKKLLAAGLIERRTHGTWAYYSVNRDALGRLRDVYSLEEEAV